MSWEGILLGTVRSFMLSMKPKKKAVEKPEPQFLNTRVYHDDADYAAYLSARFPREPDPKPRSFWFRGHRWGYRYTSFDDLGDYDLLQRPNPNWKET